MSRRVRLRTKTPAGTKRKASGDEHPAASANSLRRRRRLNAGGTQVACALPALDASILQQVRELGRRPLEYKKPANAEQRHERELAMQIRKNMSKLTGATRSELESYWHEYGWAQEVQQMRARMLQDGNLPGGDAPTRRELLRRLELMSAARP